jgi:vacuolar protein sorting-associated protein 13A/C
MGLFTGEYRFRNLKLKKEALDKFRLPVDVIEGRIGDLVFNLPSLSVFFPLNSLASNVL